MKKYELTRHNRKTGSIWNAICEECNDGYVIKAGSVISDVELKGLTGRIKTIRDMAKIDSNRVLLEDVVVKNLRDAAAFVLATNASVTYWKEIISSAQCSQSDA